VTTAVAKAAVAAATVAMATVCDNGNEGNKSAAAEGAGGRGQRFAATAPVAMASAANSGNGGGRQRWPYRRQREGGQQSTKKWQQRCSKLLDSGFATLSHITVIGHDI
jgi:hypothetical protein